MRKVDRESLIKIVAYCPAYIDTPRHPSDLQTLYAGACTPGAVGIVIDVSREFAQVLICGKALWIKRRYMTRLK